MTQDQRTLLLVDFYRSMQSLEDAFTAFEQGRLDVAECQLLNAIAVTERLRGALITGIPRETFSEGSEKDSQR